MACGVFSIAMIITFLASALLLSSIPQVASISPTPLIKNVCGSTAQEVEFDPKICEETLVFEPRVVVASDLLSMSIALLEAGISHGNKTHSYVKKLLKRRGLISDYNYVLQQCDSGYEHFGWSFDSALGEVRDGEADTATYDIKVGYTDNIDECRNALSSKNVKNDVISKENDFLALIGEVAFNTVDRLPSNDLQ